MDYKEMNMAIKSNKFEKNWMTDNNGYELNSEEVNRYISVLPSTNQLRLANKPFYAFLHFGMNTATGREWGTGSERAADFTIKKINVSQWLKTLKECGMTGVILTCKHHDGFCLWDTKQTDFNVMNSPFGDDIVRIVAAECIRQNMDFGVYLSPWDMHEKSYGTPAYNDYFCAQLTELLTNYGDVFEVWFDGAKGANAVDFEYDWDRYYDIVRTLQPKANIAICGPDIRWVGNEGGKTRKSEYSVVPSMLCDAEKVSKNSQHTEGAFNAVTSKDEDLGSRDVLSHHSFLSWYPAEVDVSIRKGWFYSKEGDSTVKSADELFDIYLNSVGNNCTLLLNVPPSDKGVIYRKDAAVLKKLGKKIMSLYEKPVTVQKVGELREGWVDFNFDSERKVKNVIISEDIAYSQRVEAFDLYLRKNGKYKKVYSGTVIGSRSIIRFSAKKCDAARLLIRQSRSTPILKSVAFYE